MIFQIQQSGQSTIVVNPGLTMDGTSMTFQKAGGLVLVLIQLQEGIMLNS